MPSGYLYLPDGPESGAKYGFQLEPSWNVTGNHVDMVIGYGEVYTVEALSDPTVFDKSAGNGDVPWIEFESFTIDYDGYVVFLIDEGVLQRYVFADSFKIDSWGGISFDCSKNLEKWSGWNDNSDRITWSGTIFEATYSISEDDVPIKELWAEPFNTPAGWEVDYEAWNDTIRANKFIDVSFTFTRIPTTSVGQTTIARTTQTTPPRPVTTAPTFTCPKNCDGKGVCIAQDKCQCINNYEVDPVLGCRRMGETTVATVKVDTVPVSMVTFKSEGTIPARTTERPIIVRTTQGTRMPTPAPPTLAPTSGNAPTTANAVAVAFEVIVALFAVLALMI